MLERSKNRFSAPEAAKILRFSGSYVEQCKTKRAAGENFYKSTLRQAPPPGGGGGSLADLSEAPFITGFLTKRSPMADHSLDPKLKNQNVDEITLT